MATGGSKQNMKLMIAVGLLLVAGIILFFQMRSGGGEAASAGPKMSEAERKAAEAEHERQVKAAEAAMRAHGQTAPATTGGSD
jgi:hypothetical protein